ncbi:MULTISPECIES: hypothetical protein [Paenibacillus]|uniref:Uncharacterized protein n=2 Tax=Paenibacillus TaxID=44249 RepID=A0A1V4HRJ7_9BACL|nr:MULTISPECIES: hypothetical protein [Paenibacillus]MEC0225893.1 hypothetical protein [Paenibacillus alba]NQX71043.1 hypothetical protein [Paenibacillus alba]OPH61328.1 hypothetical protein BC351_15445 [Paenibacillus ferrarius]
MTTQTSDHFSAFASLNRYFALSQTSKPTLQQAEEAAAQLYLIYGAASEEELLQKADSEIIEIYTETKNKIFNAAM